MHKTVRQKAGKQSLELQIGKQMSETDRRLKDHLNTDQVKRERMCLEILTVCSGYANTTPRLPKGGPDGSRDIQADYKGYLCFGAVGFVNDATDLHEHRNQIMGKFRKDLAAAVNNKGNCSLQGFVFFTNVGLTPSIIEQLNSEVREVGLSHSDIFDRERIRIVLDSSKGYAIRFRYLEIPLSDAEQKDFFCTWGDSIGTMIASGMTNLDRVTKRIQFLLESQAIVDSLTTCVKLDGSLNDVCEGSFFFQTMFSLRTNFDGLLSYYFGGGSDMADHDGQFGYAFAWLLPETDQYRRFSKILTPYEEAGKISDDLFLLSLSRGILDQSIGSIAVSVRCEPFIDRYHPYFRLIDAHSCSILFDCNRRLAEHIESISIFADGYCLLNLDKNQIRIEQGDFSRLIIPKDVSHIDVATEWVIVRPNNGNSCFTIDLMSTTPKRYDWA